MSRDIQIKITGKDESKGAVRSATGSLDAIKSAGEKTKTALLGVGTAVAGVMSASVLASSRFEDKVSNISTLISGDSTEAIEGLSSGILEMTRRMPKSATELGASAYDILSAGVQGTSNQLGVLESSAMLAVAGLGDTAGATDIMTSSINAFGLDAADSRRIADVLFKTVKNGKTTVDQMATAFGATAPIVASAGISLEEFSAATAAMTTTGLPASQAQNQLRAAVTSLIKPTEEMKELLEDYGYESGEAALKQDGLVEVMKNITAQADGNAEALGKAWGSTEALGAATALTGQVSEAYTGTLADMTEGADSMTEAFEKQKETVSANWRLLVNRAEELMIKIGDKLLPTVIKFVEYVRDQVLPKMDEWVGRAKDVKAWLEENDGAVKVSTTILLGLVGAFVALKIQMAIGAAVTAFQGAMSLVVAATGSVAAGTGAAGAVGGLAAVIAALPLAIVIGVTVAGVSVALSALKSLDEESKKLNESLDNAHNMTATLIDRMHEARRAGDTVRADRLARQVEGRDRPAPTGIPQFADGGMHTGGLAIVGERGPELVDLPSGSRIHSAEDTRRMGGVTIQSVNINSGMDFGLFKRELSLAVR